MKINCLTQYTVLCMFLLCVNIFFHEYSNEVQKIKHLTCNSSLDHITNYISYFSADSTGLYSVYSQYQDCEIMFHVSTLLPFTPNNRQQLLRKRHIGNDIVTIVFQEPGAQPFTPKNIRSQFQHVFIVLRAINPCSDNTQYR